MTRKLCSLLISSFAVLLLMGAGVEEDSVALVDESGSEAVQTAATQVETEEQAEPVAAVSGESVLSQVEEVDPTLTVDGKFGQNTKIAVQVFQHQHCRQACAECARQRHLAAVEPAAVDEAQQKFIQHKAEKEIAIGAQKIPKNINDNTCQPGQPRPV